MYSTVFRCLLVVLVFFWLYCTAITEPCCTYQLIFIMTISTFAPVV